MLTSVFGPYAQDDEYGSRLINPMELFHNQVTRMQEAFSVRIFYRSWGLLLLQANIDAPCTLLDFPSLDRFIDEIRHNQYDIVGIGSITSNFLKVKKMCELVREYLPRATILVGGHVANITDIESRVDADYIVKGDGLRWFKRFLGENDKTPIRHPITYSLTSRRYLGLNIPSRLLDISAILFSSVGCPAGCNFCCTSAMFGGKGHHIDFYKTGDELFSIMCQLEKILKVKSFAIVDENFLLNRTRALRLLDLMEKNNKIWLLSVLASANAIKNYTTDQLLRLGVFYLWIGIEGKNSKYKKLDGVDTKLLVSELQRHGIHVLGSTIIGLEDHTPENIDSIINWAVDHHTDFQQFMLYMPLPATPFYEQLKSEDRLLSEEELPFADAHGQFKFNYMHKHIKPGQETEFLLRAFKRDFDVNGPSLTRMIRTALNGWLTYKNCSNPRMRGIINLDTKELSTIYAAIVWATKEWAQANGKTHIENQMHTLLNDIYREFGLKAKLMAPIVGRILYFTLKREEKRLKRGITYEPPTFYEKNERALKLGGSTKFKSTCIRFVVPVDETK